MIFKGEQDFKKEQPRYIESLLKKAKERERTQEMVMERKIQKEQAAEAHLYGDKEKFVTGAYKRKLAEDAKWREEERRREELEKANEVTNKSDLSDFYRNLLSKNEAFGGSSKATVAPKSEVLPTDRDPPTVVPEEEEAKGGLAEASQDIGEESRREPTETADSEGLDERGSTRETESMPETRSSGKAMSVDHENRERADEQLSPSIAKRIVDKSGEAALQRLFKEDTSKDVAPPKKLQSPSKVDVVAKAKARYLARKKQKVTTD